MHLRRFAAAVGAPLIAFSCAAGCSTADPQPPIDAFAAFKDPSSAPPAVRAAAAAVVRIRTAGELATGVFLSDDGLLLTNNHVLGVDICPREGCFATLSVAHERGAPVSAPITVFVEPQHVDVGLDVAIVQVWSTDASGAKAGHFAAPASVAIDAHDATSLEGTHVYVVGHPEGHMKKWTEGDVVDADGTWFRSTAFSLPGNSGSPILDGAGHLVGVLHRGPTSEDLVTEHGVNVYSIGTASAAIQSALAGPLPTAMRSVAAKWSAADVVTHHIVFRNAHRMTADVGETAPSGVLSLLGDACDRGLARNDYASPDDFATATEPCYGAMEWIACGPTSASDSGYVCVDDASRAKWRARWQALFEAQRRLNGELALSPVSFGVASLEGSTDAAQAAGRTGLQAALDEAAPPFDLKLTPYLAAFDIESYAGKQTVDLVRHYDAQPHYELALREVVNGALWLAERGRLSGDEALGLLARIDRDGRASLGVRLYVEEVRYNSKALP